MSLNVNFRTIKVLGVMILFFGALSCSEKTDPTLFIEQEVVFYGEQSAEDIYPEPKSRSLISKTPIVDPEGVHIEGGITSSLRVYDRPEVCSPDTRAVWTNTAVATTWQAGDKLGIFMRLSSGTANPNVDRNNVLYTITTAAKTSPITTSVVPKLYFPQNNANVDFFAYYPYSTTNNPSQSPVLFPTPASMTILSTNYELPTNQSTAAAVYNADLMTAVLKNRNKNSTSMILSFAHKMTLMTFAIKAGNSTNNKTLTNVTLSGNKVTNEGVLNLSTGAITRDLNSHAEFSANISKSITKSSLTYVEFVVNPFILNSNNNGNGELLLEVTVGGSTYKSGLTNSNLIFGAGQRSVYTITVGN